MRSMPELNQLVEYCNGLLCIKEIADWPNALNGLQIENSGAVSTLGAAVDASVQTITAAAEQGVNLLIVHHGLFWPGLRPITGGRRRMLECALAHDVALYGAHLPLDIHPGFGNNAQLAASLALTPVESFFEEKGQLVGLKVKANLAR